MEPYNPLEKEHLGESVADALLRGGIDLLDKVPNFKGAGIYAIYYSGDFKPYGRIAERNRGDGLEIPIYVGKAVPKGARKGRFGLGVNPGTVLSTRLKQHANGIELTENLSIKDCRYRFLVVDDIWIPLGESLLVAKFSPLWNKLVDGFGNHDPGKGRYEQVRSRWDVLHPGRPWALKCQERPETVEQITAEVESFLRDHLG